MPFIVPDTSERRTFLELQNEVLAYGFNATRYRSRVKTWLNEGVGRVRRRARIADAEAVDAIITVAGTGSYDLPSALLRVRSLREPSTSIVLDAVGIDTIDSYSPTSTGKPTVYALHANQVVLRPVPDAVYTLELREWSAADRMVLDTDEPGLPDDYLDVVIAYALSEAYGAEDDPEMAQFHRGRYDVKILELLGDLQKSQTDRVRRIPGMFASRCAGPNPQRP